MKYQNKNKLKLYLVSSYIPSSEIDRECFLALKKVKDFFGIKYLDVKPTKKNYVGDDYETLEELIEEYPFVRQFNGGKYAKDLFLDKRSRNHNLMKVIKNNIKTQKSLIFGVPTFETKSITRHIKTAPEPVLVYGSGSISKPYYKDTEGGIYGRENHHRGGLLIEVHPNGDHRVHQLWYNPKTKDICLFKWKFTKDSVKKHIPPYLVEGDIHPNLACKLTVNRTYEDVKKLSIPNLVRHDWFDGTTISHHVENNIEAKSEIFEQLGSLDDEIRFCSNFFKDAERLLPKTKFHYIYSNHPEHLVRYLKEKHRHDYVNYRTVINLSKIYFEDKKSFWSEVFNKHNSLDKKRHKFYNEGDVLKYKDYFLHFHGHIGNNGSSGSPQTLTALGKVISGHIHNGGILRNGSGTSGTSTPYKLPYTNENGGSNWTNSHTILNENSTITLYLIKNGVGSLLF